MAVAVALGLYFQLLYIASARMNTLNALHGNYTEPPILGGALGTMDPDAFVVRLLQIELATNADLASGSLQGHVETMWINDKCSDGDIIGCDTVAGPDTEFVADTWYSLASSKLPIVLDDKDVLPETYRFIKLTWCEETKERQAGQDLPAVVQFQAGNMTSPATVKVDKCFAVSSLFDPVMPVLPGKHYAVNLAWNLTSTIERYPESHPGFDADRCHLQSLDNEYYCYNMPPFAGYWSEEGDVRANSS